MPKLRRPGKPRGGPRDGSGRPPGASTRRWRKHAVEAAEKLGNKPIDVLLMGMEFHRTRYLAELAKGSAANDKRLVEELKAATAAAEAAAPYCHPRYAATVMKIETSDPLTDLLRQIDGLSRGLQNGHAYMPLIEAPNEER
jgi:hypothetical protein